MNYDDLDEQPLPARPSSWSLALSQLPGFPREEKLGVAMPSETPQPNEAARTVTPMKSGDGDE